MKTGIWLVALMALALAAGAQDSSKSEPETNDLAYTRTLNERAAKIVNPLGIANVEKSNRVHSIIVHQYCGLNVIHTGRDAQIRSAKETADSDKASANVVIEAARAEAQAKLDQLHPVYLKKLSGELTSGQIEKVKDRMTYGVAPLTYSAYLRMYPALTDAQRMQIRLFLHEARELAMDGSTSDEKHAVFGKYKGKINNYLSKAGYDAKKAEQNLKKPTPTPSESKSK